MLDVSSSNISKSFVYHNLNNAGVLFIIAGVPKPEKVSVTCLEVSQGLVWVGTNSGHILTLPIPASSRL